MADAQAVSLGKRLKQERESRHWTQKHLAEKIGGSVPSINRWEHGLATPRQELLTILIEVLGRPPERWGTVGQKHWNVPFLRNPYYEYAYRYADEYEAVLWVRAESLVSDFAALAAVLDLPAQQERDQHAVVSAVKRWLEEHSPWLLIFDNADDPALVLDFLPRRTGGAILLTTRSQATGLHIKKIEMEKMSREEGIAFLLHRVHSDEEQRLSAEVSPQEREVSGQLWEAMDGLPLALDQAAAYIEETDCTLSDYLALFKTRNKQVLRLRGQTAAAHPESVATTLLLAFEKVEHASPAAAELLRFCAFLHPDEIPETMIIAGASVLGPDLQSITGDELEWNKAIGELRKYSLMKREAKTKMLNMHRLVQAVIKDGMDKERLWEWRERAVRAVNAAFPEAPFKEWARCERLLPHVLVCATWIEHEQKPTLEAASLFDKAGSYLRERGQYEEAKFLLEQALSIREKHPEAEHLLATSLSNLAGLFSYQGKYAEAEHLVERALFIRERILGAEHTDTAASLSHLAILFTQQRKHAQGESLFKRVLAIYEQHLGADHPEVAKTMSHLEAEHPDRAEALQGLADVCREQQKYAEAEQLYQCALRIWEQQLGTEHPQVAHPLNGLANLYREQGKSESAEVLYQRALHIRELALGSEHPETAETLHDLARLWDAQGKGEAAGVWYARALAVREQVLGAHHPKTIETRKRLIALLDALGLHEEVAQLETALGDV